MSLNLLPGHELGRYELLVPVARGGMAQLWAARLRGTRGFQKIVAVKTLLPEVPDGINMEQMFLEEATVAARIHHPNVVETLELGEHQETLYLVMEWVHGEPLSVIIQQAAVRGGVPMPIAVNLLGQACRGLHAAHELHDESGAPMGLVHRDVSPHNLLVSYSGKTKLADFGVAKATARSSAHTQAGEIKGKLAYMAPEQIANHPLDRRADIFGMGIVLYLMTTGRHPFKGDNPGATVRNICAPEPPARPGKIVSGYPPALEIAVMKALAKSPEERWATAHDLLSALAAAIPEALESTYDERAAEWMNELFGSRAADRVAQLRLAQGLADRGGLPGSQPGQGSGGSFRAVSTDSLEAASARHPSIELGEHTPEANAFANARSRRRGLLAGAVAGGLFVGFAASISVLAHRGDSGGAPDMSPARASDEARLDDRRAALSPSDRPPETPAPLDVNARTLSEPPADTGRPKEEALLRSATKIARAPQKNTPRTAGAQAAPSAAQPTSSVSDNPSAGGIHDRVDSWNANSFGGRR